MLLPSKDEGAAPAVQTAQVRTDALQRSTA